MSPAKFAALSATIHDIWSGWAKDVLDNCWIAPDGTYAISKDRADRWKRQIGTPFQQLTEEEKELDRTEARKIVRAVDL